MDIQAAAKAKVGKRKDFINRGSKVYPDTVWIKDFASLEPMHNDYFIKLTGLSVVGVKWTQSKLCA
jgi:hypothetical protein